MVGIIGVDVDDTTADIVPEILKFHNRVYATNLMLKDMISYSFSKVWCVSQEEAERRIALFYQSEEFRGIKPVEGAQQYLSRIKKRKVSITARPQSIVRETSTWLSHYFRNQFNAVYFSANPWVEGGSKVSKGEVCKKLEVRVMVEDNLHFAEECAESGIKVLLYDHPWNQKEKLPKGVRRVYSWSEIADLV